MKIRCPNCGNKGNTGYGWPAFEARGMYERMPACKCLKCGVGLVVFPPKEVKVIKKERWERMEASWEREFGADAVAAEESIDDGQEQNEESTYPIVQCPSCGNAGSSAPGSSAFEYRVALGEPKIRMCRSCQQGFWMHSESGTTEPMDDSTWAGIEAMHASLGGGSAADAEWTRREAEDANSELSNENGESRAVYRVIEALQADDWPVEMVEGDPFCFFCDFEGKNGNWAFYIQGDERSERVAIYSTLNPNVLNERRAEVLRLITAINYGLWIGNYELDMRDGEVRFKTSIDASDNPALLTNEMAKRLAYTNVSTFDSHYSAVIAVMDGLTAEAALTELSRLRP